jgi:hypothetical protein
MPTMKQWGDRIYGRRYTPPTPPRPPSAPPTHIAHRIYPTMKRANQPTTAARATYSYRTRSFYPVPR